MCKMYTDGQDITLPIIQRNSFCLKPTNYIAALLYSEEQEQRSIAVGRIFETRSIPVKEPKNGLKDGIRVNVVPVIDFKYINTGQD